ncbi:MAG: glycosyl transferase, group 1 [Marmoricola sp.]|nr:glycosyl transferase, group 1 [Marmoricola sp.]
MVELKHPDRRRHVVRVLVSITSAVALLVFVLPRVAGTTLADVRHALSALTGPDLIGLTLIWAAGLVAHSFVLTGALPGLSRRRALTLNLTGSAVSNVLPFGGAAGMALNYAMIRSWRVSVAGYAAFTLLTNVWVVLLKLTLPAVALTALLLSGTPVSHAMRWTAIGATVALTFVVSAFVLTLASRSKAERAAAYMVPGVVRIGGILRRSIDADALLTQVLECHDRVAAVAGKRWLQLSAGMIGYAMLQATLLFCCLSAVGGRITVVQVLTAYAVDRVLTTVFLTPGGAGVTEAGTTAVLVALGGAPGAMTAGVLLYRAFTFALEIPVGGVWLAGWLLTHRRVGEPTPMGRGL